ncbi:hypothetical protein FHT78_000379 [Rhizobium sp. BK196]|uniref:ApaLI family restriction endonuclease n=1 Tax=Rhizobium sp. BK196 TaxID=2587073 RepID=UPI0017CBF3C6|nr:ApaLI family restriction endonuclease [Rhizobium sp. BK196]MBB3308650.1 hypothetical protein [Rhizobium sp. BK196]
MASLSHRGSARKSPQRFCWNCSSYACIHIDVGEALNNLDRESGVCSFVEKGAFMILYKEIRALSDDFERRLKSQIEDRVLEMDDDDRSHHILYQVLGITAAEGHDIDVYQNKGRFLYKYAGSFLEAAAKLCVQYRFPQAGSKRIDNTLGQRPKTFEIDSLTPLKDAIEIKWRDATTDGDHITKEHTRLKVIHAAGYKPVRVMFYYPNRAQARKIQQVLEDLYISLKGEYYYADSAWKFIREYTGVDLLAVISRIAEEKTGGK